jgi:hypothetical protein
MQLLAKNPAERIQTAAELAGRLQTILGRLEAAPPMAFAPADRGGAAGVPQPLVGPPSPWAEAGAVAPPPAPTPAFGPPAAPATPLEQKPTKLAVPCLGCAVGFLLLTGVGFVAWKLLSALFF